MDRKTTVQAFEKAITRNNPGMDEATKKRIEPFYAAFGDVKKGETVDILYAPDVGTRVLVNGAEKVLVRGADVGRIIFSIWLGEEPVDDDMTADMLSGKGK
jgi:hypothetical protein